MDPHTPSTPVSPSSTPAPTGGDPIADRRAKLHRLRTDFQVDPFGHRIDNLLSLQQARDLFNPQTDAAAKALPKDAPPSDDPRPFARVAGRIVLHRDIGKLIFITLRDHQADLQIAVSKNSVTENSFKLAKIADLGDLIVVHGRIGSTKTGEITLWTCDSCNTSSASSTAPIPAVAIACKSLAPPPEKWHGLTDPELRYRQRYVDLYTNPQVMQTFLRRSAILHHIRNFLHHPPAHIGPGFIEVETPTMQAIAGGAAARPFITHHNALDIDLFLRIAPELYLKRLLVGGMPRVFEVARNFRNEGLSPRHNPEFTMIELYQAFGDYQSMMTLIETLIHTLAVKICSANPTNPTLPFGDLQINYSLPFRREKYHDIFARINGFPSSDHSQLTQLAQKIHIQDIASKDHDVLLSEVWEQTVEPALDPNTPTFIIDYPASICPLTRRKADQPDIAERFELYIAGMEIANAYTELNDPDIQDANFRQQLAGQKEEDSMAKMDTDFVEALRVGMPPAGGLGFGIDRLVMLLTNSRSIRDVILFPLMKPQG